jgi:pimeloyl-ACP methyl ester carboxylesterase
LIVPNECINGAVAACPAHFAPIPLAVALERYRREADRGTCDTGRYRCPYFAWGSGPTLVFVPGLADDGDSFIPLAAQLSERFCCVGYNWPTGLGDGARLDRYRHADFVSDLTALLDHLGAARAFLAGYSFGSTVALAALDRQPQRIPRAALLSGFAHRRLAPAELLLASLGRYWPGPLRRLPLRRRFLQATQGQSFARCEPAVWHYYLDRMGELPMGAMGRRALVLHRTDIRRLLPRITQPVLLICGDCDPLVNKQCETELLTGLPRVMRVELPECGHQAIFTHPEAVAEAIAQFLESGWQLLS